jgi:hypothetical protein
MTSLERDARLDRGARVPLAVAEDRAQVVQSAALSAGWNALVTASVVWPGWASQALVTVKGQIALKEASSAPAVYGGALKIVTGGVESLETLCFGVYDNRGATGDYTIGGADDGLLITTPAATVDAALMFYPWDAGWYPGAADSRAACHLLATFLR